MVESKVLKRLGQIAYLSLGYFASPCINYLFLLELSSTSLKSNKLNFSSGSKLAHLQSLLITACRWAYADQSLDADHFKATASQGNRLQPTFIEA